MESTATIEETEEGTVTQTATAVAPSPSDPNVLATARQKALDVRAEMKSELIERDVEIDLTMLSLIARRPGLLVGTGGVAKSMTIDMLTERVGGQPYKILLRKSMPIEEIFGPLSIKGLENDQFRYITKGKAAEANVIFLDEIFKANAVVLNAMLMLLNEAVFINDGVPVPTPWWAIFGASNELPTEPELAAFRDRFAWAKEVKPVSTDDGFKAVLAGALNRSMGNVAKKTVLDAVEVEALQHAASRVTVPQDILNSVATMKRRAEGEFQLIISARRYISGLEMCRAQAALNGRQSVMEDDLTLFQHTLWTDLEDAAKAYEITLDYAGKVARVTQQLRSSFEPYHNDLASIRGEIPTDGQITQDIAGKVAAIQMNLKRTHEQVNKQIEEARTDGRDVGELESLLAEINADRDYIRNEILG